MKVILFTICLLILCAGLFANPIMPRMISELWFTENNHLMMELEFSMIGPGSLLYVNNVSTTGSFVMENTDSGQVIDLTEKLPNMTFYPQGGHIILSHSYGGQGEELDQAAWGIYGYPLLPGQSLVQWDGGYHLPFDTSSFFGWYLESPPTPGIVTEGPLARDTLKIIVTDQNGMPVPNVPIYYSETQTQSNQYTNAEGIYTQVVYPMPYPVVVRNPVNNSICYNHTLWLQPNQTTEIPIRINTTGNSDYVVPVSPKADLTCFPSPFYLKTNETMSFLYNGLSKINSKSTIKIYDAKGRFVSQVPMSAKGTANWKPKQDISTGMYFARLISGNRIVDTATLTVIK